MFKYFLIIASLFFLSCKDEKPKQEVVVSEKFKSKAKILFENGTNKLNTKDFDGAMEDFSRSIQLFPHPGTYSNRGLLKHKKEDYIGAIEDYTIAINLTPNDAMLYINRGVSKLFLNILKEAIDDFDKAIKLEPDNLLIYKYRGMAKEELGDNVGARLDLQKVEESTIIVDSVGTNLSTKGLFDSGLAKQKFHDFEGSIADFTKLIELDPDYDLAYFYRALSKRDVFDYFGAISDLDKAILHDKNNVEAFYVRGYCKSRLKDYSGSIADFSITINQDENHAKSFNNRAASKFYLGDKKGACADARRAKLLGVDSSGLIIAACN